MDSPDRVYESVDAVPGAEGLVALPAQLKLLDCADWELEAALEATPADKPDDLVNAVYAALRRPGRRQDYVRLLVRHATRLRWSPRFDGPAHAEELLLLAKEIAAPEDLHGVISVLAAIYNDEGFLLELVACRDLRVRRRAAMHTADARLLPERLERLRTQPPIAWPAAPPAVDVERETVGASLVSTRGVDAWLRLEEREGLRTPFAELDQTIRDVVNAALSGAEVVGFQQERSGRHRLDTVSWYPLPSDKVEALDRYFDPASQEAAGVWYLPDDGAQIKPGRINAAYVLAHVPEFAMRFIDWDRAWVRPHRDRCALALWSLLGPLMDGLVTPLDQRSAEFLGARESDVAARAWRQALELYEALAIGRSAVSFWLSGQELIEAPREAHIAARLRLVDQWANAAPTAADRFRAHRLRALVARYYEKAKDGKATRRQVLTGPTGRTLSAYFGGDWLAFLDYLGEEAHPREQLVRALPKVKIVSPDPGQVASVAQAAGVEESQIEQILATFWGSQHAQGPVPRRQQVMRRFWDCFDALWAGQREDDPSLFWLVADMTPGRGERDPDELSISKGHSVFIASRVLPADLLESIHQLWGTVTSPVTPDRGGSSVDPEAAFAEAFGPALRFWHAVATTAWDTTVLGDTRGFYDELAAGRRMKEALAALRAADAEPPAAVLRELHDAQDALPEPTYALDDDGDDSDDPWSDFGSGSPWSRRDPVAYEVRPGVTITRYSLGRASRPGWREMNEIITRHRRAWAERHLETYLRRRWEEPLRTFGEWWYRRLADRGGRQPTKRQIGEKAARLANDWFGGDIGAVCRSLRLSPPFEVETTRLLPADRRAFAERVLRELGGDWWYERRPNPDDRRPSAADENWGAESSARDLEQLARRAAAEVQRWELHGTRSRPGIEFYADQLSRALQTTPEEAVMVYGDAICRALVALGTDPDAIPGPDPRDA